MITLESYDRAVAIGVDMQNDFCPGGALGVEEGDQVIQPFNEVARIVRCGGGLVALTRDWHPKETTHFETWAPHCVAGTLGAEFHPGLRVLPRDVIISKGTGATEDAYSGFDGISDEGLTLEEIVTPKYIEAEGRLENVIVLLGGLATDYCDKATTLDSLGVAQKYPGYVDVFVVEDAIAAVNINPGDGERAIEEMKAAGAIFINSKDVLPRVVAEQGALKCQS